MNINIQPKELYIDVLLMIGTIWATFVFGVASIPLVPVDYLIK